MEYDVMKEKQFEKYVFDKNRDSSFNLKSAIMWEFDYETKMYHPLFYVSKPREVSEEDFNRTLDMIDIHVFDE